MSKSSIAAVLLSISFFAGSWWIGRPVYITVQPPAVPVALESDPYCFQCLISGYEGPHGTVRVGPHVRVTNLGPELTIGMGMHQ